MYKIGMCSNGIWITSEIRARSFDHGNTCMQYHRRPRVIHPGSLTLDTAAQTSSRQSEHDLVAFWQDTSTHAGRYTRLRHISVFLLWW
jgi:hypothetical protein